MRGHTTCNELDIISLGLHLIYNSSRHGHDLFITEYSLSFSIYHDYSKKPT